MKKMRMNIIKLMPLGLLMGICMAQTAQAGVKVKATVRTPNARIHVTNVPFGNYRSYTREVLPLRMHNHYKSRIGTS